MKRSTALYQMHFAAVLFGISGIFGKLTETGAGQVVLGRGGFALLAMTFVLICMRRVPWAKITAKQALGLLGSGILLAIHWVTFFIGVKEGGIAVATLGFASFPAFVCLLETLFLRDKLSRYETLMIALVTFGLILVTPHYDFSDSATKGLLWGILSGFTYALLTLVNRYVAAKISSMQVCWWQNLSVLLCLLPFWGNEMTAISSQDWVWIACLGLLCTGLSHSLFINGLTVLKARDAAMIIALEPVYAIAVAWLLFHEQPSLRMLAGGALIIFTIIWSARHGRQSMPT